MDSKNNCSLIQPEKIPLRLTVGIVGSREIKNEEMLRKTVYKILDEIIKEYSNNYTKAKLCVMSSLAEKTDRPVVEEVFNYDKDAWLKVVLPLNESDLLEDLDEDSKNQFEALKKRAKHILPLREKLLKDEYPDNMLEKAGRQSYINGYRFIVNHCDILIVIEDDGTADRTFDVSDYANKQNYPIYKIDVNNPVYLDTKEKAGYFQDIKSNLYAFLFYRKTSSGTILNFFRRRVLKGMDSFNFNIPDKMDANKKSSLKIPEKLNLSEDIKQFLSNILIPYRTIASDQAGKYQNEYRNAWLFIVCMAFMSIFSVSFCVSFDVSGNSTFVVSVIGFFILVFIFLIYYITEKITESHKKWMQYRLLAELLRSAFYLIICGVNCSYNYHKEDKIRGKEKWVYIAFEEIISRLQKQFQCSSSDDIELLGKYVAESWIEGQKKYHKKNSKKNAGKSKQFERIRDGIFFLAVAAAFIEIFFHPTAYYLSHCLTLAALTFPPLVAAIEAFASFMEYKQLSMHSEQMAFELERIEASFNLLTHEKLERLLNETEALMIKEVEDWLELVSFAELHTTV